MAAPEGANLAGSAPAALPVASLTGMPLSRSGEGAEAVADAALAVAPVPEVWDAGRTAEAWDEAAGAEDAAVTVCGVHCDELLDLKVDVFCPPVAPAAGAAAGAADAAGEVVALPGAGVVVAGVAERL